MDEPDRAEKVIRFGCGALFGLAIAGWILLQIGGLAWPWALLMAASMAFGCACTALNEGDEFWWSSLEDRGWW
ncbi:MAG: hypothetical protein U0746_03885 [Gemmataceae bacterium]